jgi:hypothetical protein
MEAVRQQPKRPLRYVVVDGGDHAFEMPDGTSRVATLFDDFLNWVLDRKRQTAYRGSQVATSRPRRGTPGSISLLPRLPRPTTTVPASLSRRAFIGTV